MMDGPVAAQDLARLDRELAARRDALTDERRQQHGRDSELQGGGRLCA